MNDLDPRLNAFRPDLADFRLEGRVTADHYVEAKPARIKVAVADIRRAPDASAGLDTQLVYGDRVKVFESRKGWSWVQSERDGYVGYVKGFDLQPLSLKPTHEIIAPRTFAYSAPDMKSPATRALSMGSWLVVEGVTETRGLGYVITDDGEAIVAHHVRPLHVHEGEDYVAWAEKLAGTPYLWGGASAFGIDCSGLLQLSLRMTGHDVLRDTDMQEASVGTEIERRDGLQRGDLVFWKGHVAIVTDSGKTILHANGASMDVRLEPLNIAIERIGHLYGLPTSYRRPHFRAV